LVIYKIGGEKILASREGAAEGMWPASPELQRDEEEFRRARAFRRSACPPKPRRRREAEAVSSVQKMFEQSCIIPPLNKTPASSGCFVC